MYIVCMLCMQVPRLWGAGVEGDCEGGPEGSQNVSSFNDPQLH